MDAMVTTQEAIHDLEMQISRHRDEMRLKEKELNDALIRAEEANKRADVSDAAAEDATKRADNAIEEARVQAGLVEAANTAAAKSAADADKAVAAAAAAKESLSAARAENEQLKAQVKGLETDIVRLSAQVAESQAVVAAVSVLKDHFQS